MEDTSEPCYFCVRRSLEKASLALGVLKDATIVRNHKHPVGLMQRKIPDVLDPCINAVNEATAALTPTDRAVKQWVIAVVNEVKNIGHLRGRAGDRSVCGIYGCLCHLRVLNGLLLERRGGAAERALEARIVAAENELHASRDRVVAAYDRCHACELKLQVAEEALEEFKWDTGFIDMEEWKEEMGKLAGTAKAFRAELREAEKAYTEVDLADNVLKDAFNVLLDEKRAAR